MWHRYTPHGSTCITRRHLDYSPYWLVTSVALAKICAQLSVVIMVFVEESINDSVSVDLGICNPGAVGNKIWW